MFITLRWKILGQTVKTKTESYLNSAKNYFTKERIYALNLLGKAVMLVAVSVAMPWGIANSTLKTETIKTSQPVKIALDWNRVNPIVSENAQVAFALGESEIMKAERENAQKQAQLATAVSDRTVVVRESASYSGDPDFATKRALAQRAAAAYGIPWQILEAVWQVESGKSWDTSRASSAGARGPMQFMPGTWRAYGQDGNGDGNADAYCAQDALYGAANYLAANGAASGDIHRALLAYNHSDAYVHKVLDVAYSIGF